MVKQTAHDGLDGCSNHSCLIIHIMYLIEKIRVLEKVDSASLSFVDVMSWTFKSFLGYNSVSIRGYSLIGKTTILHIVILGSSPDVSKYIYIYIIHTLKT